MTKTATDNTRHQWQGKYESIVPPFDQIVERLIEEWLDNEERKQLIDVRALNQFERRRNKFLNFELQFKKRRWRGYAKIAKTGQFKPGRYDAMLLDQDVASVGSKIEKEYEILRKMDEVFGSNSSIRAIKPVACYPDLDAIVTEEVAGEDGLEFVKRHGGVFPGERVIARLEEVCFECGQWLAAFQKATPDPDGRQISLDEMREYIDRRLVHLTKKGLRGFSEQGRSESLRVFDSLADQVDHTELNMTGVHGDFSVGNVLISSERLVVMDFETFTYGSPWHDVTYFYQRVCNGIVSRFNRNSVERLNAAFVRGYDHNLQVLHPLFQLFRLQHILCAMCLATAHGRWYKPIGYHFRVSRYHAKWLRNHLGIKINS